MEWNMYLAKADIVAVLTGIEAEINPNLPAKINPSVVEIVDYTIQKKK